MRRRLQYLVLGFGVGLLFILSNLSPALAGGGHVAVITLDSDIEPISARYLRRGLDVAASSGAQLAIIRLDTPGGLLSSTRDMVEAILSSEIPVAVYVSPPGARAASAGVFVTAAANFAVMAPGTNIGAASPVGSGGEDLPATLSKKVVEDTLAFIRSIAEQRSRNATALEETITAASSYSAREAVERNVVDFIARDMEDMLVQLDGRTAETAIGRVTLQTRDARTSEIGMTLLERFLSVIANPTLAVVLLLFGGLAIIVEMWSPGFIGPGVVGAIAFSLGLLGLGNLPVNWVAVGLIVLSMILFFVELQAPGWGIFGLGSAICFVLGAFLLFGNYFDTPVFPGATVRVSGWLIGFVGGTLVVATILVLYFARATGSAYGYVLGSKAALVGRTGIVVVDLQPSGMIRLGDEEWTAAVRPGERVEKGVEVTVLGVYGDILKVARASPESEVEKPSVLHRFFGRLRSQGR
ncbi:MAG: nodulation protein NfeD [Chloroflexi bacterium]|nr:nodulation protein NfeD [Chloroflexota bacterium]